MSLQRKTGPTGEVKLGGEAGSFTATFSIFNTVDSDGDVTLPGAFEDGAAVRVAAWGHNWNTNPIGRAVIRTNSRGAQAVGRFFVETSHGLDAYRTLKGLGELAQWSYGYSVLDAEPGVFEGRPVNVLRKLAVVEVSPVMQAAQPLTGTDSIKGLAVAERTALQRIRVQLLRADLARLRGEERGLQELEAIRARLRAH